jgi:hypothetical protein
VTTVLRPASYDGLPGTSDEELDSSGLRRFGRRKQSWFARDPAWPIVVLLIGWPVWWFLGIGDYFPVLLAIPMIRRMYHWRVRGERTIRLPPGFALWFMFLVVVVIGAVELSQAAPDSVASPTSNRVISYALRTATYLAITVVLLYAGNLTEQELPRRRLAWMLGLVGIYAVIGGVGGVADPHLQFTSPFAYLVPKSSQAGNGLLQMMLHPGLSQVQNTLGYAEGRPRAPFDFTNMWGNCLAILLPWLVVAWWSYGNKKQRKWLLAVAVVAFVPVVYSLDRGLWLGIGLGIGYLAIRFAMKGKLTMLVGIVGVIALAAVIVVVSPLQTLIQDRLNHGKSNAVRSSLSGLAVDDAIASPVIGFGDTRHEQGSTNSIAVGKTLKCLSCGSRDIGGNGQLWMMFVSNGFLGAFLYCAFFLFGIWRYWRDPTPYGLAGVLVLLLQFPFMLVYVAVGPPLVWTMLAYALLWKNDRALKQERAEAAAVRLTGPGAPGSQLAVAT